MFFSSRKFYLKKIYLKKSKNFLNSLIMSSNYLVFGEGFVGGVGGFLSLRMYVKEFCYVAIDNIYFI